MNVADFSLGIVTNLATDLLKWGGKRFLDKTKLGARAKAKAGVLDSSLESEVQTILLETYQLYFRRYPERRFQVFYDFFAADEVSESVFHSLFDFTPIDYPKLEAKLEQRVGRDYILYQILEREGLSLRQLIEDFIACYLERERSAIGLPLLAVIRIIRESEQPTPDEMISPDDYLSYVAKEFEEIDTLGGRKVPMKDFYISLTVGKRTQREEHTDSEGSRAKETVIAPDMLAWREELKYGSEKRFRQIRIEEALNQRTIVILGDPGSGKTTLLRNLAYKFVKKEMPRRLLPIFVPLGQWAREKTDLLDFVVNDWGAQETDEIKQQKKQALSNWLKLGECILLFDGLDEVGDREDREDIIRRIEALSGDGQHSCPVVVTSRIVGYDYAFSGRFQHLEVMPLDDRQIQQYLDGYFTDEQKKSTMLWQALRSNARMKALATNPFLLMVIAFVSDEEKLKLPARRIDLYDRATKRLLKLRPARWRGNERKLLEEAAYHFFSLPKGRHQHLFDHDDLLDSMVQGARQRNLTITSDRIEDILIEAEQKGGLLTQLGEDIYAFLHLTFQEYLTACAIAERSDWLAIVKSTIWEDRWEEVLRLLAAKISDDPRQGRENLDQFFRTILPLKDDIFNATICRLAKCASDCWRALPKDIQKEIRDKLFAIWLRQVKNNAWMDESALYALATADKALFNKLIDALENEDDEVVKKAIQALGNIADTNAVDALLEILGNDDYLRQSEAIASLGKIGDPRAIEPLAKVLQESGGNRAEDAAYALKQIGGEKVRGILLSGLKESDHAILSQDLFGILLQTGIEDIVEDVSKAITYPDGQLKHWLSSKLSAIDYPKIERAAGGMGMVFSADRASEKIPEFQEVLSSGSEREKIDLLNNIAEIIGSGFNDFVGKFVIKLGQKREISEQKLDQMIRNDVEESISTFGADLSVQNLIGALLTTSNEGVRALCIKSLGEIGNEEAFEGLLLALEDESDKVKIEAVQAFGKTEEGLKVLGSEEGLEALNSSLESEKVKKAVVHTLGRSSSKQASKILIETLRSDPDDSIRREVAEALGSIGDSGAIPYLVQMLEEDEYQIREYSAQSLGQIGGHQAVEALYQRLQVEDNKWVKSYIWEGVRSACLKGEMRLFPDGKILGFSSRWLTIA